MAVHPIDHLLGLFDHYDLPQVSQDKIHQVREAYSGLAHLVSELPANAETTVALRKLLESKDAAVRAIVAAYR